jgi:hypothetical protein
MRFRRGENLTPVDLDEIQGVAPADDSYKQEASRDLRTLTTAPGFSVIPTLPLTSRRNAWKVAKSTWAFTEMNGTVDVSAGILCWQSCIASRRCRVSISIICKGARECNDGSL